MQCVLTVEPGHYAVYRGAGGPDPVSADPSLRVTSSAAGEIGGVCPASEVPPGAVVEGGWRWFRVHGPLPFSTVGVLAGLSAPLAAAGISIFVVSTFDTDHLLVSEERREEAVAVLRDAGCTVRDTEDATSSG